MSRSSSQKTPGVQWGDLVMVHLCKEQLPVGLCSKLKQRNYGPCCILKKLNPSAQSSGIATYMINYPWVQCLQSCHEDPDASQPYSLTARHPQPYPMRKEVYLTLDQSLFHSSNTLFTGRTNQALTTHASPSQTSNYGTTISGEYSVRTQGQVILNGGE